LTFTQSVPPPADVAIVGFGWAGSIVAAELARHGHDVVVFERGPAFASTSCGHIHEPGNERWTRSRVQRVERETYTLRYDLKNDALPLRRLEVFLAGEGVGGAGILWGGLAARYNPAAFKPLSVYSEQLAAHDPSLEGVRLSDWPISYDDLESGYTRFELTAGVAGDSAGNPFAGRRSADYPIEYLESNEPEVLRDALRTAGLHPYRLPSAEITVPYTNPDGITREPCDAIGSTIATPLNTTIPAALRSGRVTVACDCSVRRICQDKGVVNGLVYTGPDGVYREYAVARIVLACWTLSNTRLLLLSGIGQPYNPARDTGVVGRNYANHILAESTLYWDRKRRGGAPFDSGWQVSDFDPLISSASDGPIGGVQISSTPPGNLGFRSRFSLPHGSPRWGYDFKKTLAKYASSYLKITALGEVVPMRDRYMDLDPIYKDAWGDPLLRITFDWRENERRLVAEAGGRLERALMNVGADVVNAATTLPRHWDTTQYQSSHASGGTMMGDDPGTSVVDPDLQCWTARNLWIVGASVFPTNPAPNPTATVAALSYRLADTLHRAIL
jgi:gluconate 2-dehydrogenase alpha chain